MEDVCDRIAILYGGKVQAEGQVGDLLRQANKRQFVTSAVSDQTIEKIKSIVSDEGAEFEVSAPMEKLETFFINTVIEAQQQAKPTSGAVSTTDIGDFLTAEKTQEDILDKLVSASETAPPAKAPDTEKVATPVEVATPKPDKDLLNELTKPDVAPETDRVKPAEGVSHPKPVVPPDEGQGEERYPGCADGRRRPAEERAPSEGGGGRGRVRQCLGSGLSRLTRFARRCG